MNSYEDWNQAIGTWFFGEQKANRTVVLTVDGAILRSAMRSLRGFDEFNNDQQAQVDFLKSIRERLESTIWQWWPGEVTPNEFPKTLALLAAQVLAAFCMDDADVDADGPTNREYRGWLCHILHRHASPLGWPEGWTSGDHRTLWRAGLEHWANHLMYQRWGRVVLPGDMSGPWRDVRLPLSQALLRPPDFQRLHFFFESCGLTAGESNPDFDYLVEWKLDDEPELFSRRAKEVLRDRNRHETARLQIQDAFQAWDGTFDSLRLCTSR